MRLLLLHVRGAQSFEDIRSITYPDDRGKIVFESFSKAAEARHLIADDREWKRAMEEASFSQMPYELRMLFISICTLCMPTNALKIWEEFKSKMCEDYTHRYPNLTQAEAENLALLEIQIHFFKCNKTMGEFDLPIPTEVVFERGMQDYFDRNTSNELEFDAECEKKMLILYEALLNPEQRTFLNIIKQHVINNTQYLKFMTGNAGCGKTRLLETICHYLRSLNLVAIVAAWSGIAATLIPGGQTCHSRFGLSVPFTRDSKSNISLQSSKARYIKSAKVVIIEEASMAPEYFLTELDRLLRDITGNNNHFGNKIIIICGDFRQNLPVEKGATRSELVRNCINCNHLWHLFMPPYTLTQNMRVNSNELEFVDWLKLLGDGQLPRYESLPRNSIKLPKTALLPDVVNIDNTKRAPNTTDLIDFVFGTPFDHDEQLKSAILSPYNKESLELSEKIIDLVPG